jgi:uncharacterized membrane protein YtjA (UPF0391 family)
LAFLIIAMIAAVFGFTTIAGTAAGFAQILFFFFLVAFVVSVVVGLLSGGRGPRPPV